MHRRLLGTTAVLALVLAACGGSSKPAAEGSPAQGSPAPAATSGGSSGVLRIQGFGYHPSPLIVTPGQTVTITNLDSSAHTVTSDKAGAFKVDDISAGKPFTFTAPSAPGTYTFFCEYHSSMHGTLIVKAP